MAPFTDALTTLVFFDSSKICICESELTESYVSFVFLCSCILYQKGKNFVITRDVIVLAFFTVGKKKTHCVHYVNLGQCLDRIISLSSSLLALQGEWNYA